MNFDLNKSIEILERTPSVLELMLKDLSDEWILSKENGDGWSPFDVVGHLLHGEKTDWMTRLNMIIEHGTNKTFEPFDRFAQFHESEGKSMTNLLDEFKEARNENLEKLKKLRITDVYLSKKGMHPHFGEVTLRELLSTWTVHDLTHTAQICKIMAKQYKQEVGPWLEYINLLKS